MALPRPVKGSTFRVMALDRSTVSKHKKELRNILTNAARGMTHLRDLEQWSIYSFRKYLYALNRIDDSETARNLATNPGFIAFCCQGASFPVKYEACPHRRNSSALSPEHFLDYNLLFDWFYTEINFDYIRLFDLAPGHHTSMLSGHTPTWHSIYRYYFIYPELAKKIKMIAVCQYPNGMSTQIDLAYCSSMGRLYFLAEALSKVSEYKNFIIRVGNDLLPLTRLSFVNN